MKCPECVKEGKKSCVKVGDCETTTMGYLPYYDEEGGYHDHNPNVTTRGFACDRGHSWWAHEYNKCPNPDCNWTSESRSTSSPEIKEDTRTAGRITTGGGGRTRDDVFRQNIQHHMG